MARALLLALTCAAAASGARYVDYSGVKMPVYGAGDYDAPREPAAAPQSDDYRGHSPDAPASLDYKYEEEPRIKTEKPAKDSDEPEVWRKPGRKQRGLLRPPIDSIADAVHKYEREEEDVPKFRMSHRYPKHRSRLKSDVLTRDEEPPSRRAVKYNRDRKDDVSDIDSKDYFHVDKDDFPDDKSKEFEEDVKFVTRRGNRRKPRDKFMKRTNSDLDTGYDEQEMDDNLRRTRPPDRHPDRTHAPHAPRLQDRERYRPMLEDDDDDSVKVQPLGKGKAKPYEDYDDYYDMKRVNNIKSKLPSLLRRPTVERSSEGISTGFPMDIMWTHRRRLMPPPEDDDTEAEELITSTIRFPSPHPRMTATANIPSSITRISSTTTTTTTPTTTTMSIRTMSTIDPVLLSLAEKSRLSILKKDQRKKGQHVDAPTKKPPVLLQVTQLMPTVVMVEPPTSANPWMRVRELSEDSPGRIEKVKKLMRHKLVADARSIHDLTNNWDDMVCDYIDVALLDSTSLSHVLRPQLAFISFMFGLYLFMLYVFIYLFKVL